MAERHHQDHVTPTVWGAEVFIIISKHTTGVGLLQGGSLKKWFGAPNVE